MKCFLFLLIIWKVWDPSWDQNQVNPLSWPTVQVIDPIGRCGEEGRQPLRTKTVGECMGILGILLSGLNHMVNLDWPWIQSLLFYIYGPIILVWFA